PAPPYGRVSRSPSPRVRQVRLRYGEPLGQVDESIGVSEGVAEPVPSRRCREVCPRLPCTGHLGWLRRLRTWTWNTAVAGSGGAISVSAFFWERPWYSGRVGLESEPSTRPGDLPRTETSCAAGDVGRYGPTVRLGRVVVRRAASP